MVIKIDSKHTSIMASKKIFGVERENVRHGHVIINNEKEEF